MGLAMLQPISTKDTTGQLDCFSPTMRCRSDYMTVESYGDPS